MIDLRYLVISLIGVFLALAVGLMIGSALGSPDRRDAAYEALRGQFDLLRTRNQEVQDESVEVRRRLTAQEQAVRELLPLAVRQRLSDSPVCVVICGEVDERPYWNDLEDAIRLSGSELAPVVRIRRVPGTLSTQSRARLRAIWREEGPDAEPDSLEGAEWLIRVMVRGLSPRLVQDISRETGIEVRRGGRLPVRRILVLPGEWPSPNAAANDRLEVRVVEAARAENARVVAAETEASDTDALRLWRRQGLPTVDNIDTASGQIAAILALAGAEGQFGSKVGAGVAIPSVGER
jgi:hypothetical protein